jgi:hypothetical protein
MTKENIDKLLDDAKKSLDAEYESHVDTIKSDLRSFKTKTLEKIQNVTP